MRRFPVVIYIVAIALAIGLIPLIVHATYSDNSTNTGKKNVPSVAGSLPAIGGGTHKLGVSPARKTDETRVTQPTTARGRTGGPRSSAGPSQNPAKPSSPSSPPPTQAELEAALLTTADLPGGGFSADPPGSGVTLSSLGECPELNDGPGPNAQAAASFTGGGDGPYISETLLQYSVSEAKAQISLFTKVAQACNNLSFTADGLTFSVGIVTEQPPGLGDESVALRINAAPTVDPSLIISGDLVAVRHGGTVVVVTNVGLPLEATLTPAVVSRAYAKVAALW